MTTSGAPARQLGFFTRLLDDAPPAERYRLALEQIERAEAAGYDAIAVAQHHFDGTEGGLPAPLPFLAHAAARTSRVQLTTGVVTLALENALRVAEDAVVLDALSGGRLQLGFASGGSPTAFAALGLDFAARREIFETHLAAVERALAGGPVTGEEGGPLLYPPGGTLGQRIWIATFSLPWAIEAGRRGHGHGLMLSRTQPRPADAPEASLAELQNPLIDAYLEHLPAGVPPRISVARSVFVAEDGDRARTLAAAGLRRAPFVAKTLGTDPAEAPLAALLSATDAHTGDPEDVRASLAADPALARATHLSFQVHSMDPPHQDVLRSIDLITTDVAPHLGWAPTGGHR